MRPFRWLCVGLTLLALEAQAQALSDSFESGSISAPWALTSVAGITVEASTLAAHRGQYGARLIDAETTLDAAPGTVIARPTNITGPDLYSRIWVREVSQTAPGGTSFVAVFERNGGGGNEGTACAWGVDSQQQLDATEQGLQSSGNIDYAQDQLPIVTDGGWMLLETAVTGLGTQATVRYAVDGRVLLTRTDIPAVADHYTSLHLGMVYANSKPYQCVFDFDDVRLDGSPMGSHFSVQLDGLPIQGRCVALSVRLLPTFELADGGAVAAPYDLALDLHGLGALYSDSQCAQLAVTTLAQGSSAQTFYFRAPDAGTANVTVEHPDFLPATAAITVLPAIHDDDGGVTPEPTGSYYAVHCQGCDIGSSSLAWLAALAVLARRRATSRPPSSRS